jgi:phosphomannomutase
VRDSASVIEAVRLHYCNQSEVACDELDGLTVSGADWWFNLRPSNTEPLLRLNVEAPDEPTMMSLRDSVLAMVQASDVG